MQEVLGLDVAVSAGGEPRDDEPSAGAAGAATPVSSSDGRGASTPGDDGSPVAAPPAPRASIGPAQAARAAKLLAAMAPADQAAVQALLDHAAPAEKSYLERAVASKHTPAEIERFAVQIAGKDSTWMDANLHVVGTSNGQPGIRQQWRDSCGPTTIEAMRAELDPIYALGLRTANASLETADGKQPGGQNAGIADEQKDILEAHGGRAVPRLSAEKAPDQTYGMKLTPALNEAAQDLGIKFTAEPFKGDASLDEIDAALKDGVPVPLRLSNPKQGHFVLVTAAGAAGQERSYNIHDPWTGRSYTLTGQQIASHSFNIAGYNNISHIYRPGAAEAP